MNPAIRRIIDHMKANLQRRLTLTDLARSAKLSRSRMSDLFKAETGLSPGKYLKTLRMQKAAELLETTSLTVEQIRAKVGMRDKSHFIRAFKKTYGKTPSKYRARRVLP